MQKGVKRILAIPAYVFGFLLLGLVSGYLTFKVMSFSKTVDVPDLKGKTVVEANELLKRKGLYLKVEGEEHDPLTPSGRVVRQDIPFGNKVKENRGIKVFLSKGPRVTIVPDLVGQNIGDAEGIIAKSGLRIGRIIRVHSASVEKDRIVSQRPAPDEAMKDSFSVVVSLGRYDTTYFCPDFSGKSKDEAVSLAEKMGLKVELTGQGEKIKAQKPKPSAIIRTGDTIRLFLEGETIQDG